MVTAVRMVELTQRPSRAPIHPWRRASCSIVTAAVTVAFDLILAVEIGIAVAAVLALRRWRRTAAAEPEPSTLDVTVTTSKQLLHEHIVAYRLDGALFFGAAQRFLTELTAVTDVEVVILRLPDIQVLDATGAQALGRDRRRARSTRHHRAHQGSAPGTPSAPCEPSAPSTASPTNATSSTTSTTLVEHARLHVRHARTRRNEDTRAASTTTTTD